MILADREVRRQALAGWIADLEGTCFVTAMLPVGNSRALLEDRIREWSIRVNKYFLGSRWYKPHRKADWMSGFVFFEFGDGGWHAHMILRPPKGVHPLKFLMRSPFIFCPHSGSHATWFYGKPVTPNGKILVQIIEGPGSARRVAKYVTKEIQYRDEAMASWRFIDQLTACRRPR